MEENKAPQQSNVTQQEAEYATFVDKGTQIVLQEAIQKIVETFNQKDTLEDILGYLEKMRDNFQSMEDRLKEMQQRDKQMNDKIGALEISVRNLLQRVQTMEVQLAKTCDAAEATSGDITRLTQFFEKSALARMFTRLKPLPKPAEEQEKPAEEKK